MIYKGDQPDKYIAKGGQKISAVYVGRNCVYPSGNAGYFIWPHTGDDVLYSPENCVDVTASVASTTFWQPKWSGYGGDYDYWPDFGISHVGADSGGGLNFYIPANVVGTWKIDVAMDVYPIGGNSWEWWMLGVEDVQPYYIKKTDYGRISGLTSDTWNPISYTATLTKDRYDYVWRFMPVVWHFTGGNTVNRRVRNISARITKI